MIYSIIKYTLRLYFPLFFKKVYIEGLDNVPKNAAIIFVPNHQNTFVDATLVAYSLSKNIFYLVRSDIFVNAALNKLFTLFHLIPIYRKQDRSSNIVQKNRSTFSHCFQLIKKQKPILIFPEGTSEAEYKLNFFKKGAARIALKFLEEDNGKTPLYFVPVAINYENHHNSRSAVWIKYCNPIYVNQFMNEHSTNPARCITKVTKLLQKELNPFVIQEITHLNKKDIKHTLTAARLNKISQTSTLISFVHHKKKIPIAKESKFSIGKLIYTIIKPLFFPTTYLVSLLIKKANDSDFTLAFKCFGWLLFGSVQIALILMIIGLNW